MGVGLCSPSRDAANWPSSRLNRSVERQRRYGWLRIGFTGCVSSELQFGVLREVMARERQGTLSRRPGSALSGEYAPDSARTERSSIADEPGKY